MKRIVFFSGLLAACLLLSADIVAQRGTTRGRNTRSRNTNTRRTPPKPQVVAAPAVVDTPQISAAQKAMNEPDTLPIAPVVASRRPTSTVEGNLILDKTPLQYDHLRIDDQVYKQIVWREINIKEKMNLPFRYEATEDNGSQKFFNILLRHIKEGDITAFSNVNDRFTQPLKTEEIASMLMGKKYIVQVPDLTKDPDMSKGITKDSLIRDEFNENTIIAYRVKEEIIFDRETSRMHFRILGIAPVRAALNEDGSFRDAYTLFWLYYPELRPVLAKYEAYNPKNMGVRMSWEEIFEARYFASYIVKSTINNPFDRPLAAFISDPLQRLLEGENIKETIFNWEQNQWSY